MLISLTMQVDKSSMKVRETFVKNVAPPVWEEYVKPTVKTLRDKFQAMMLDHRDVDRTNASTSGLYEDISEADQMLEYLIHEKDSEQELRKEWKEEATEQQALLLKVGEQLWNAAATRCKKKVDEMMERKKTRKRKCDGWEEEEEWQAIVQQRLTANRDQEKRANDLFAAEL